jgi:hypothetical protein
MIICRLPNSIVVSIPACHAAHQGSSPCCNFFLKLVFCNALVERTLAAGLCYLLSQYLPPFFTAREDVVRAVNQAGLVFTVMIFLVGSILLCAMWIVV